jgi:hypothetical protein
LVRPARWAAGRQLSQAGACSSNPCHAMAWLGLHGQPWAWGLAPGPADYRELLALGPAAGSLSNRRIPSLTLSVSIIGAYHRPKGIQRGAIVILAALIGGAAAGVAEGQGPTSRTTASDTATGTTVRASSSHSTPGSPESAIVPTNELTHPQVRPAKGGRLTAFVLIFTLREAPGHQGVFATDYRVQVTQPPGSTAARCLPTPSPTIESGAANELKQIALQPPAHGWCLGTYRATVFLQRGPYCPPPTEGQLPTPCPELATQDVDTGTSGFTVVDGNQTRNARIVGDVNVCNAPGHCMTRTFNVFAFDSAGEVVAHATTFGEDNRFLLRVTAGIYSLRATSDGLYCTGSAKAHAHQTVTSNITCLVP